MVWILKLARNAKQPIRATTNPKPPKRTKAEVQQAALEKKKAAIQKRRLAEVEKEKKRLRDEKERELSARKIASIENSVQRSQKQLQLRSERPDILTMETYRVMRKARQEKAIEESEMDVDMVEEDLAELPPASTVDTDSDAGSDHQTKMVEAKATCHRKTVWIRRSPVTTVGIQTHRLSHCIKSCRRKKKEKRWAQLIRDE